MLQKYKKINFNNEKYFNFPISYHFLIHFSYHFEDFGLATNLSFLSFCECLGIF